MLKTRERTFFQTAPNLKFIAEYPLECPHCNAYGTATIVAQSNILYDNYMYHLFILQNECCSGISQAVYKVRGGRGELIGLLPVVFATPSLPESLEKISPRFVKLYTQCFNAEQQGCFELAGSGYRNAIEVLVKDFAINELQASETEVTKKTLAKAIETYLPNINLAQSADVVRVLGNDHTHYERKYDDIDFQVLKRYLQIFINNIDCEYLIRHPVVKTNPNLQNNK